MVKSPYPSSAPRAQTVFLTKPLSEPPPKDQRGGFAPRGGRGDTQMGMGGGRGGGRGGYVPRGGANVGPARGGYNGRGGMPGVPTGPMAMNNPAMGGMMGMREWFSGSESVTQCANS